ncbi:MAG TPA: alpha/beta hydrolase [Ktedonobacterales bacterium]|nr:alpha/beta hydrolase [Ktedonobacterales bacterium]
MDEHLEAIAVPGASLWTARQGSGPALVLCHGGPGLWDYLAPVARMLDDSSTVYRYDQRACGRSSGGPPYDVATAVADLEALRAHWRLPAWMVGGHSWGATLALAYALTHPERTRGLIYLSGTGVEPGWHAEFRANWDARLSPGERAELAALKARRALATGAAYAALDRACCELQWSADFSDRAHARALARTLFVGDLLPNYVVNEALGADGRRFAESPAMPARLATLRVPALILHGATDPRPAWAAEHLARLLPAARLAILPAAGHMPWLDQPDQLAQSLRAFVASL